MNLLPCVVFAIRGAGLPAAVLAAGFLLRPLRSARTHQPDGAAAYPEPSGECGQIGGDELKARHAFIFAPT